MYLLDTNLVSELRKARTGKADPGVVAWASGVSADALYVSVITILGFLEGPRSAQMSQILQGSSLA